MSKEKLLLFVAILFAMVLGLLKLAAMVEDWQIKKHRNKNSNHLNEQK